MTTRVHLINQTWNEGVEIQAKLDGSETGIDQTVPLNGQVEVNSDGPNVLWRRRLDPSNSNSAWQSGYTEVAVYEGDDKDVEEHIT